MATRTDEFIRAVFHGPAPWADEDRPVWQYQVTRCADNKTVARGIRRSEEAAREAAENYKPIRLTVLGADPAYAARAKRVATGREDGV